MDELLPCPFCGSDNVFVMEDESGHLIVECDSCLARGPKYSATGLPADTLWNTRYVEQEGQ